MAGMPEDETLVVPPYNSSLSERSQWVLERLRTEPGVVVTNAEGRWLQLENTGSLTEVIARIMPRNTSSQNLGINRWLAENGFRRSEPLGGPVFKHFIKLEDAEGAKDDVPAGTADGGVDLAMLDQGADVLAAAAQKIRQLRELVKERDAELVRVDAENKQLATEVDTLRRRAALAMPFQDGVADLARALAE